MPGGRDEGPIREVRGTEEPYRSSFMILLDGGSDVLERLECSPPDRTRAAQRAPPVTAPRTRRSRGRWCSQITDSLWKDCEAVIARALSSRGGPHADAIFESLSRRGPRRAVVARFNDTEGCKHLL